MKKIHIKRPFLSLCVIFRDNADTLPKLLESVKGCFDEYVFTDTGSVDGSRKLVEAFVRGKGKVTDFPWIEDFAAARNACFQAASGTWRMFLDSDDVLLNGKVIRAWIEGALKQQPDTRGVFVPYDYDKDESLFTMRLACFDHPSDWKWTDAIHERLDWCGGGALDAHNYARTRDFGVKHRRKTPEEKLQAIQRNAVIARREYETTTDPEYKARLSRTIAMAYKAEPDVTPAIPHLKEVVDHYWKIPEGRQAAADLSRILASLEDWDEALKYAKMAGPSYESIVYSMKGEFQKCLDKQIRGVVIPQQTTHEGFLTEKAFAPIAAAHAALNVGLHPSGIENIINGVRADLRMHPAVRSLTTEVRRAVNRITIVVPGTPQPFDDSSGGDMLGGSEEAVVYLSRALAQLGRNVRVYTQLPCSSIPHVDKYGVDWRDVSTFDPYHEHGTLVTWRSGPFIIDMVNLIHKAVSDAEAGVEGAFPPSGLRGSSLWLHDQHMNLPPNVTYKVCASVDSVVVLSEHHRRKIIAACGGQDPGNMVALANGIVREQYEPYVGQWEKDQFSVVYSSCPTRGLRSLLTMWPKIKEAVPQAKLDLYYDWSMARVGNPEIYEDVVALYEGVRHLDVVHHGGVGHAELNAALRRANVWAYSHFENTGVETFCISAVKATACGATVVTAPNGALPEVVPDAEMCISPIIYAQTVIEKLKNPDSMQERAEKAKKAIETFAWDKVAQGFSDLWTEPKAQLTT